MTDLPKHDWVPTGHETLACQTEGCGLSPLGDRAAFFAAHDGPITESQRTREERLEREVAELQATFDLRWKADMRAIKMWQAAHPGSELVWPDHADMVVWLLGQIEDLRVWTERIDGTDRPPMAGGDHWTQEQAAAFEAEHEHDIRLDCLPEYNCRVIAEAQGRLNDAVMSLLGMIPGG